MDTQPVSLSVSVSERKIPPSPTTGPTDKLPCPMYVSLPTINLLLCVSTDEPSSIKSV